MSNQLELAAEQRALSGKQVKRLRQQGIVPAVVSRHNRPSLPIQVNDLALQKLLARGRGNVILLKVRDQPAIQTLIKHVQRDAISGKTTHVDFYQVTATEKLRAHVALQFVNEPEISILKGATVSRPLNDVLVECLPGDLPSSIQVDLSRLTAAGAALRVADLIVDPAITILTDHNETVASLHQRPHQEQAEEVAEKTEASGPTPEAPAR